MQDSNIYYNEDGIRLYKGDCLEILKTFPENTFDMVFADPPYFLSGGTFTCQNGQMVSIKKGNWDIGKTAEENFKFHYEWLKECRRVLKKDGTL